MEGKKCPLSLSLCMPIWMLAFICLFNVHGKLFRRKKCSLYSSLFLWMPIRMQFQDLVNLCNDEEGEEAVSKPIKQSHHPFMHHGEHNEVRNGQSQEFAVQGNKSSNSLENAGCSDLTLDNDNSSGFVSRITSPSEFSGRICRQFWKAGEYDARHTYKTLLSNGRNHMRVHPKFLHSNATSHKWVFGAIEELLDNAVDEIQNGASFVIVDKIFNPRDGTPALLIQDDGGGMDLECLRRCMSFGFSEKSKSAIGKYGNGFKTSTMRLGADVIVFTRCKGRILTQSVGLLSYTFLTSTGHGDIVVPMVDYEFDPLTGIFKVPPGPDEERFYVNLMTLLQWSPYAMESELLKQFDDMGDHGTKVIVFNLWLNDDGDMELDFELDKEDIVINGACSKVETHVYKKALLAENHIGNRFRHSLRAYLSILYLRKLKDFQIILRGRVVGHHNLADNLNYIEYILYQPRNIEAIFVTTIGFLKEAPKIDIHGFNVYHKNRLILPFWRVLHSSSGTGRGVVGILEANFIEPTHDKQDFERASLLHKLQTRLREMMVEYWNLHCGLVGYQCKRLCKGPSTVTIQLDIMNPSSPATDGESEFRRSAATALHSSAVLNATTMAEAAACTPNHSSSCKQEGSQLGCHLKRKQPSYVKASATMKWLENTGLSCQDHEVGSYDEAFMTRIMQENKRLKKLHVEYEKIERELQFKVQLLNNELEEVNNTYERLISEFI